MSDRDEQLIRAALETVISRLSDAYNNGTHDTATGLGEAVEIVRAIDPAEVLSKMGDERCAKCGHPRSNHHYRHPFISMGDTR